MTKYDPLGLDPLVKQEEERRKLLAEVEKNALALSSSKGDAKMAAMSVEEKKRAQDEARKREITAVEYNVSPDILKVAKTIDDIVNNGVFSTEVWLYCPEKIEVDNHNYSGSYYKAQVTVKEGLLEINIKHTKTEDKGKWYNTEYDGEAVISINTEKDKIHLFYTVRKKKCSEKKNDGVYRISRWARKSPKAFRFLAEDSVKNNNPFYINDFISIYKIIPEILAKAIAKMSEEEAEKKKQLEREAARLSGEGTDIAEQIKAYEPDRTSQAKKPKLLIKRAYIIRKEITYRSIRDIEEKGEHND